MSTPPPPPPAKGFTVYGSCQTLRWPRGELLEKVSATLPLTRITARRLGGAGEQAILESNTESATPKACTAESGARQSMLKRSSLTLPIWKSSSSSCASGTSWMFLTEASVARLLYSSVYVLSSSLHSGAWTHRGAAAVQRAAASHCRGLQPLL